MAIPSELTPDKVTSTETAIGESILQKYRDGDAINNFFRSLTFDFAVSLVNDQLTSNSPQITQEFVQRRLKYHRMKESVRNQVVWVATRLNMLYAHKFFPPAKSAEFRVGIILSDILPETGESDCKVLVSALLGASSSDDGIPFLKPSQILILGRRDHLVAWASKNYPGLQTVSDWERNTKVTANLSFLVLLGSAMHLTLVEEQLRGHDISKTVLMPILSGISETRMLSLFGSKLIVSPCWNDERENDSDSGPQNVTWASDAFSKGRNFPDLGVFRRACMELCQCHGLDETSTEEILQTVLPLDEEMALHSFQKLAIPPHDPSVGKIDT